MAKISNERDRERWIRHFQAMELPVKVEAEPWKPTRSNEQNALLFAAMYPAIADAMGYTVDDVHEYALGRHFGWVDKKVPKTPRNPEGVESVPFRTTTRDENGKRNVLSKAAFSDFLETVERIGSQAGVWVSRGEE